MPARTEGVWSTENRGQAAHRTGVRARRSRGTGSGPPRSTERNPTAGEFDEHRRPGGFGQDDPDDDICLAEIMEDGTGPAATDLAAHLGAQLPLIVRGAYYDQYDRARRQNARAPSRRSSTRPAREPIFPRPVVVCSVLARHVDDGQMAKIWDALPKDIRQAATARLDSWAGGYAPAQGRRRYIGTSVPVTAAALISCLLECGKHGIPRKVAPADLAELGLSRTIGPA